MERRTRPAVAAILALAVAGLGHAYLRRWARAAAWFLTILITAVVLVGAFADPDSGVADWPLTVVGPLVGLFVLSAVDAYLLAARAPEPGGGSGSGSGSGSGGGAAAADETELPTCPNCGREVDPELDFCQWCTQRLSFDADGASERKRDDDGRTP